MWWNVRFGGVEDVSKNTSFNIDGNCCKEWGTEYKWDTEKFSDEIISGDKQFLINLLFDFITFYLINQLIFFYFYCY